MPANKPITKVKSNYSLSYEARRMVVALAVDTMKNGGKANKSNEVEQAIRNEHARRGLS